MLEKTNRINYLYDFYQALLTPKQSSYMALYYLDDYSLGEIAEEYDVSRQVYTTTSNARKRCSSNTKRSCCCSRNSKKEVSLFQK